MVSEENIQLAIKKAFRGQSAFISKYLDDREDEEFKYIVFTYDEIIRLLGGDPD